MKRAFGELLELYAAHVALRAASTATALAETGFDRLLIHSGVPYTHFVDDQDAPFHETPHFVHWSPVEGPGHILDVVPGKKPRLVRLMPRDYWYEPPAPAPGFVRAQIDVVDAATPDEVWGEVASRGAVNGRTAFIGEAVAEAGAHGVPASACNPKPLVARLDWARSYKSPWEAGAVAAATVDAARGFRAAEAAFRGGSSEMEAHHAYLAAAGQMEEALPYPTIIGFDERSATLHYHGKKGKEAAPGRVMLVDAGTSLHGYACDITRTFTSPAADPVFVALLAGMEALQQRLVGEVRPGLPYLDLHLRAHGLIGELLCETGVLRVGPGEAHERLLTRPFFPHGLGHFLGIQVHDVAGRQKDPEGNVTPPPPEHPFLRTTRVIEEGMLFSIEPGLYFIPMLLEPYRSGADAAAFDWALVDRLSPCGGIRIEDDIWVTGGGSKNLTRPELPA